MLPALWVIPIFAGTEGQCLGRAQTGKSLSHSLVLSSSAPLLRADSFLGVDLYPPPAHPHLPLIPTSHLLLIPTSYLPLIPNSHSSPLHTSHPFPFCTPYPPPPPTHPHLTPPSHPHFTHFTHPHFTPPIHPYFRPPTHPPLHISHSPPLHTMEAQTLLHCLCHLRPTVSRLKPCLSPRHSPCVSWVLIAQSPHPPVPPSY